VKKIKYYIVCVEYPTGKGYIQVTEDRRGDDEIKFRLHSSRQHATMTQSFHTAKRYAKIAADTLRRPTSVEDLDGYKKNPAPNYKSRAAKLVAMGARIDAEKKRLWNEIGGGKTKRLTSAMYYSKKWSPWRKLNEKSVRISDMLLREAGKENARASHKRNPAPSPASRSAKFHLLRAKLLTQLQIAKRKGSFVMEQLIGQKLRKLDRMFYAPRTIKRRK
jgi:hypothetical protein